LYQARLASYALADVRVSIESDDPEVAVNAIVSHPLLK